MMNWFILALVSSIFLSIRELSAKNSGKYMSSAFLSWGMNLFVFLMFLTTNLLVGNHHTSTSANGRGYGLRSGIYCRTAAA